MRFPLLARRLPALAFNAKQCFVVALLLTFCVPAVQAAYCSLRDPVAAIRQLYPDSNQYRSLVQVVSADARDEISERLPFTLHFNEIGQHTLFLALDNKRAVGFVHARSELSEWGIIELAWAINLDLSIEGVSFQRCRSPRCTEQFAATLSSDLQGKSFAEIRGLLNDNGNQLEPALVRRYQHDAPLALSVVRSALKTLAVTEISWAEDVASIRRDAMARANLAAETGLEIRKLAGFLPAAAAGPKTATRSMINPESVQVHLVLKNSREVGRLVEAHWRQGGIGGDVLWLFSPQGTVIDIQSARKWQNTEVAAAFRGVIGQQFSEDRHCSSATEIVGKELFSAGFRESASSVVH